jgi:outer membrane protein TolC
MTCIKGRILVFSFLFVLPVLLQLTLINAYVFADSADQAPITAEFAPEADETPIKSAPASVAPRHKTAAAQVPVYEAPTASEDLSEVETLLNDGKRHYRDGEFGKAISVWNKVLTADPSNRKALRYIERAEAKQSASYEKADLSPAKPTAIPPKIAEIPSQVLEAPMTPAIMQPEIVQADPFASKSKWDADALTLKDAVTIALANHKPARIALEEVLVARMKVTEAKRGLFPAASLKNEEIEGRAVNGAVLSNFRGREFTLELQQPLFQGGRLVNTLRQSQINLAVAVKNYDKLKEDFIFEVEQAYFILTNSKDTLKNLQGLQASSKEAYDAIAKQKEIGVAREVDVLNIQSQYEDVNFQVSSAVNDLMLAKLTLLQLLGFEQETEYDVVAPPTLKKADYDTLDIDLDEALKLAYQNRSDLYIRELMVQFQQYGVEIAKSKARMKVDLTGSYGLSREAFQAAKLDLQEEFFIGLKGSLPLGPHTLEENFINQDKAASAGQTTANTFESVTTTLKFFDNLNNMTITQAQISYHKALDEMYKAQKSLDFEVKKAYFDYKKAILNLDGYLSKMKLGEAEVKIAESQYDLNQVSMGDVLRNRVKLTEYHNGYGKAASTYYTAVAKINKTVGISGYYDPITGKREASLAGASVSRRPYIAEKSRVSNYQAELSRAEKIVQSIKPEERWWEVWEKDETVHANIKDRWWETWEKDTQTGVVRPKTNWWQPWKRGTPTAPKARKKWWQMWEKEEAISDTPYQKDQDKAFAPQPEDLVTRDMVKQLFQGGRSN